LALPIAPAGIGSWAIALSVIGIVYASLVALAQKRFKLLIAYSSMAHVGMISAGVLANNAQGITGGIFEMFSHGILAVGLFLAYDIIEKRMGHDRMSDMGGIRTSNPLFAFLFFIVVMGSVALPFTSGFVGEFLLIQGLAQHSLLVAGIAGLTVILGAAYMLRAFQSMMLGGANLEKYSLVLIVLMVVILGVYPSPLLDLIQMNF
jgi:NADH-quinone oxidoreductase subunit M